MQLLQRNQISWQNRHRPIPSPSAVPPFQHIPDGHCQCYTFQHRSPRILRCVLPAIGRIAIPFGTGYVVLDNHQEQRREGRAGWGLSLERLERSRHSSSMDAEGRGFLPPGSRSGRSMLDLFTTSLSKIFSLSLPSPSAPSTPLHHPTRIGPSRSVRRPVSLLSALSLGSCVHARVNTMSTSTLMLHYTRRPGSFVTLDRPSSANLSGDSRKS